MLTIERVRDEAAAMSDDDAADYLMGIVSTLLGRSADRLTRYAPWSLTRAEASLFDALLGQEGLCVSHAQLAAVLFWDTERDIVDENGQVKVMLSRIRKKIAGTGFAVRNVFGEGYYLERSPGAVLPWNSPEA